MEENKVYYQNAFLLFFFSLTPSMASRRLKLLMWWAYLLFFLNNTGQDLNVAREFLSRKGHCEWKIHHTHGVRPVTARLELCLLTHCLPHIVRLWAWASMNPSSSNLGSFKWPISSQSHFVVIWREARRLNSGPGGPRTTSCSLLHVPRFLLRNPISPVLCWHWALPSDIWTLQGTSHLSLDITLHSMVR